MTDNLRPKGTVEVPCSTCPVGENGERWFFWVDALDPRLPDGPFQCPSCTHGDQPILKAEE